jgi:hypothetical protein
MAAPTTGNTVVPTIMIARKAVPTIRADVPAD